MAPGWFLECTTAGTSSNDDLTFEGEVFPSISIKDGSVVWTYRSLWDKLDNTAGYIDSNGDLNDAINPGIYIKNNSIIANSPTERYAIMATLKSNWTFTAINQLLYERHASSKAYRRVYVAGTWLPWVQQEEIVEKSLNRNGYIKYASGLIMQLGMTILYIDTPNTIVFPISFSSENICINLTSKKYDSSDTTFHRSSFVDIIEDNCFMAYPTQNGCFMWFAIGY